MPDDVVVQKLTSIDRCLRAIHGYIAGDLNRLREPIVLDAGKRGHALGARGGADASHGGFS